MKRFGMGFCFVVMFVGLLVGDSLAQVAQKAAVESETFVSEPMKEASAPRKACYCAGEEGVPAIDNIKEALHGPLTSSGLDYIDTSLKEVVNFLQDAYNIPIVLDTPALDDIGIGPDEPVTVNLRNISLQSALRIMLKQIGLTYIIRDEVLLITTPEEAETQLTVCVYPVADLVESRPKDENWDRDIHSLIDAITVCVEKQTWAKSGGGEAEICPLRPGLLVISQSRIVHEEITDFLVTIRKTQSN